MYKLKLCIKGLPKQTNASYRCHWTTRMKEARKWKALVESLARNKKPKTPLKSAHLKLTRFSSREPDWDGLVSGFKHVIDGLKASGIILDDKMSIIGKPDYFWTKTSPKDGKIEIEVTERGDYGNKENKENKKGEV